MTAVNDMLSQIATTIENQKNGDAPVYAIHFNRLDLEYLLRHIVKPEKKKGKTTAIAEFANMFDIAGHVMDTGDFPNKTVVGVLFGIDVISDNDQGPSNIQLRFRHGSTKGQVNLRIPMDQIRSEHSDDN